MKLFSRLVILTVLNIWIALALPNDIYDDETFRYQITSNNRATIKKVINTSTTSVTIPPFVNINGEKYIIDNVDAQFLGNTKVSVLTVSADFDKYSTEPLNFKPFAFLGAYKLRTISLKNSKVTASSNGLYGLDSSILIRGPGTNYLVQDICYKLLDSWKLPIKKNYHKGTDEDMRRDLFTLAKNVKDNYYIDTDVSHDDNAAVVFALEKGSRLGIARVYRNLAIYMGVDYFNVQVVVDNNTKYAWNFIRTLKNTNNYEFIDIHGNDQFLDCCTYNSNFFIIPNTFKFVILREVYEHKKLPVPEDYDKWEDEWVVYNDRIGCELGEVEKIYPDVEKFRNWTKLTVPPKYIFF